VQGLGFSDPGVGVARAAPACDSCIAEANVIAEAADISRVSRRAGCGRGSRKALAYRLLAAV
jgi:hypothetical protein